LFYNITFKIGWLSCLGINQFYYLKQNLEFIFTAIDKFNDKLFKHNFGSNEKKAIEKKFKVNGRIIKIQIRQGKWKFPNLKVEQ